MPGDISPTIIAFLVGLAVGSFLNVVVHRLPRGIPFVSGRSMCPSCGGAIAWRDNVPIVSFLLLRARCRRCRARISWRYPLVELVTGVVALLVVWYLGATLPAFWMFVFYAVLLVITLIDWSHRIIPDALSIGGMVFGWLGAIVCLDLTLVDSLLGSLAGGGSLFLVAAAYQAVRKVEGMGGGDIKLMGMIGAFVGWRMVLPVLVIASAGGALYGLYLMRRGASARTQVAFGSFLAPAAVVVNAFGAELWRAYLTFISGRP
jgi:leader peptidase (prepilin peptidase)/N-methyltransferase